MTNQHSITETIGNVIVGRPVLVVVLFLLLTAGFATGLDDIERESGPEQFSEDVDAYQINEYVDETFGSVFEDEADTTLLLQDEANVLSQESLLQMLRVQDELADRPSQRVLEIRSPAQMVAKELDPTAKTTEDQLRALRTATDTEIRKAIRAAADNPGFTRLVGEDFNSRTVSSSAAIGIVTHDTKDNDELFERVQLEAQDVVNRLDGDIRIFGSGISDHENNKVLSDSIAASIPAVIILLVLFLIVAYRDPFDVFLGVIGLAMALIWTFGFLGVAGITFSQLQVALPPLLLAIGVDFGIHFINRYREELGTDPGESAGFEAKVKGAIRRAIIPLSIAFFMVMMTSVIGFSANLVSGLSPIADFGLVAAAGIVSVTLIFGVFLPSAKLLVERARRKTPLPAFTSKPLGSERSILGRLLPLTLTVTSRTPLVFLLVVVLTAGVAGYYGQGVGTSFEDEDMLPPEELPAYLEYLPSQMQPGTYTVTENLHFLEDKFETTEDDTVTIYLQGSFAKNNALESIYRAGEDPPSSFVTDESGQAEAESILTVIDAYADRNPEFATLVERSDRNDNGVPDTNVKQIYEELLASPYEGQALRYITDDYREARVIYSVEADASDGTITEDAASMAEERYRFEAVETGNVVVFQRVTEEIFGSAIRSLGIALSLAIAFLMLLFYALERRPSLGIVTLAPVVVTLLFLVATMRYLEIPFNMLTATILSVTVGVGVDYSIHVVHRFVEEFDAQGDAMAAARFTLRGTGGALFGTTITTVSAGLALYYLSLTPILYQFGVLIAFSVTYSFITSTLVLPVVLIVWTRWAVSQKNKSKMQLMVTD